MKRTNYGKLLGVIVAVFTLSFSISPAVAESNIKEGVKGFDKGVSWANVVPLKKVTFVNFDKDSYLDDYAYLAAVPTTVFYDKDNGRLFSYPLLYYQDPYPVEDDKERSLNARQGIDYFMEDWMSYCNGKLDGMTLINVPESKVEQWSSRNITTIKGSDPYSIASKIALHDWSYSDYAVVAVVEEEFEKVDIETTGEIKGIIPAGFNLKEMKFEMEQPNIGVGGNYEAFEITEPYKYVVANMFWKNVAVDLDLQLYDDQLGMADASSNWNVFYGAGETVGSYVYHYGTWEIGVTYMPTQGFSDGKMKSMFQHVQENNGVLSKVGSVFSKFGLNLGKHTENVDIKLYPGVDVTLNEPVSFGCRDVEIKLMWDNPNVALGMVVLDTSGAETAISPSKEEIVEGVNRSSTERVIHLDRLGETAEGSRYYICVFALDNITRPVEFKIEYSWHQEESRKEGDCLASATEGAVLASVLNAPMLYVSTADVPLVTSEALYKLGVKEVYLLNLGNHASRSVIDKLKGICKVREYRDYKDVYDEIRGYTGRNDVIF
ncbi:MAG TPA: hypothetical protein ENI45_02970, partial [Thermoplasmatales archaeon]|nr:hypothetical protein [Thermoplasmatales archaeon]